MGAMSWDEVALSYEETVEKKTTSFSVPQFVDYVAPRDGVRIADIACGPGVLALAFAKHGAEVVATDLSETMVARLVERARDAGVEERVRTFAGDAEKLAIDAASLDAAASNFGVIFCPNVERALSEMNRATCAAGKLMFSAWTTEARSGWSCLLAPDYVSELGFAVPPRVIFHWNTAAEVVASCERAGWHRVDVEVAYAPSTRVVSWERVPEVLESPGARIALAALDDDQRAALGHYLARRAHEEFGDGEVVLEREAWLVRGRASD